MSFLRDLALAHQHVEGWHLPGTKGFAKGSLSYRNSNPGNLRLTAYQKKAYGAKDGAGGFARFPSYEVGLQALMDDVLAKLTGRSAHIDYSRKPTFVHYIRVYAPKEDGNDPDGYCQKMIRLLPQWNLSPSTPLSTMVMIMHGEAGAARLKLRAKIRRLERLIRRFPGAVGESARRGLKRLLASISG